MKDKVKYIFEVPAEKFIEEESCDILGLKFTGEDIEKDKKLLKTLLPKIEKPLMIRGSGDDNINKTLLPALIEVLDRECIIAYADENTYKSIVPYVIKGNHKLVLRTPIDINLCKELNILSSDLGLDKSCIIIDTDIGGLGYGLEYGYSIMEKIKLESSNDEYLNMPMISFVSEETAKTKEAKDVNLAPFLEISSAMSVKAAGANYIVLTYSQNVKILKEFE